MQKKYIGLIAVFIFCSMCFAEEQKQQTGESAHSGKIAASTISATEYDIRKDIYERNKQSYKPFFLKIINDKAFLLYQRQPLPFAGEVCFVQESKLSDTDQTKKQVVLILSKLHKKLIPFTFTFEDDYSLWYRMPDYDSVFDSQKIVKDDTPFLTFGDSCQGLVENLKKDNSFFPYGLTVSQNGECVTIVLPTASLRLKDAKIISFPLNDLESTEIPEGWTAVGADLMNNTIYVLLISYDTKS